MALTHCILGKFLGVVCHFLPPPLDDPTLASVRNDAWDPSSERWNCGRVRCPVVILPKFRLPRKFRDLLHAANVRHGTDGFTSHPKEVVLRIFFALKIRRLRPQTWLLKASTLPLDNTWIIIIIIIIIISVRFCHQTTTNWQLLHDPDNCCVFLQLLFKCTNPSTINRVFL